MFWLVSYTELQENASVKDMKKITHLNESFRLNTARNVTTETVRTPPN
jgi:hypothetical protein